MRHFVQAAVVAFLGIFVCLLVVEGVSQLTLFVRGQPFDLERHPEFAWASVPHEHAWPESLSSLPKLPPHEETWEKNRVIVGRVDFEPGMIGFPPRNGRLLGEYRDGATGILQYTIPITTDEHRRRTYPHFAARLKTARNHIFAFGCSLTFGQSLRDEETFLARIAEDSEDLVTYNAGLPGEGATEALAFARNSDVLADIRPREGIGVYVAFNQHLQRFVNSTSVMGTWRKNVGVVVEEDPPGNFIFLGRPREVTPWSWGFARIFANLAFTRLFRIELPFITEERVDSFFRMITSIRAEYWKATRPENPFVFVIFPYHQTGRYFYRSLGRTDLDFIDYSIVDVRHYFRPPYSVPREGHPSAEFNRQFAKVLAKDLRYRLEHERPQLD